MEESKDEEEEQSKHSLKAHVRKFPPFEISFILFMIVINKSSFCNTLFLEHD